MRTAGKEARSLAHRYLNAKAWLVGQGYSYELDWYSSIRFDEVDERQLLREAAWVILGSGISERVLQTKWGKISSAFCDWRSAEKLLRCSSRCLTNASVHFKHEGKLRAIVYFARFVRNHGLEPTKRLIRDHPDIAIRTFPFIGQRTYYHLAKNLGLPVAKPDRHLVRIAAANGYTTVNQLCLTIAEMTGEPVGLVDLVLWRACVLGCDYKTLVPNGAAK